MIFSDLPSPAEASNHPIIPTKGFAQAGNRFPLFGIMLQPCARTGVAPSRLTQRLDFGGTDAGYNKLTATSVSKFTLVRGTRAGMTIRRKLITL